MMVMMGIANGGGAGPEGEGQHTVDVDADPAMPCGVDGSPVAADPNNLPVQLLIDRTALVTSRRRAVDIAHRRQVFSYHAGIRHSG